MTIAAEKEQLQHMGSLGTPLIRHFLEFRIPVAKMSVGSCDLLRDLTYVNEQHVMVYRHLQLLKEIATTFGLFPESIFFLRSISESGDDG
jgi:hypothetical protein